MKCLGPMVLWRQHVSSLQTTYYLNASLHRSESKRQAFASADDMPFLWTADVKALQPQPTSSMPKDSQASGLLGHWC